MSPDETFAARLRRLREAPPYWSRADLARRIRAVAHADDDIPHVSSLVGSIKQWESEIHMPGRKYRPLLARALGASEGDLFGDIGIWHPQGLEDELNEDDYDRLTSALARSSRLDRPVVDALATILAQQRRLDDMLGPNAIMAATAAEADAVVALLRDARGSARELLLPVAAEYVQFHGWLNAEARNDQDALHLLTDAESLADETGDGKLVAQATNFKGWLARQQGVTRATVRHFLAAHHTPGAHPAQRLGDAVQAAQGLALLGDAGEARRMLDVATALEEDARSQAPGTAYWLTPDYHSLNIGLALLALKEHRAAVEHLRHGLDTLPADQQGAEWAQEYRMALHRTEART
ncbi:transcriptional regulator [Spongiactinospora rosea]|uniref:Transcriptional regulator n=1 Tax=Spongiactinospora rosea TaxID=2248750 RepID=A0A366M232_9ACTN|nr:transcriptional regulator [Spongiactinospora rosea]RBQ20288.1 transcriptional regulator [Spongiactinospora rosea]